MGSLPSVMERRQFLPDRDAVAGLRKTSSCAGPKDITRNLNVASPTM